MISFTEWAENFITLSNGKRLKLEAHQKQILDLAFAFDKSGRLPYSTIVYSCPKKSGKTTVNAIVQTFFAYNVECPTEVISCANKKEQAVSRAFRELKGFIQRNAVLMSEVLGMTNNQLTLKNGSTILAIPNDAPGEAGSNHGCVCFDELWGYTSERDYRLWDELGPVPTKKASIRFVSTYAGYEGESTLLEDLYGRIFDKQGNIKPGVNRPLGEDLPVYTVEDFFCYWDTLPRMPWQTPSYYEPQKKQLRLNTYLRIHENRWVSSESGLFDMEKWDSCVDSDFSPPLPDKNIHLWVGVDASVKKDRSAVVSV